MTSKTGRDKSRPYEIGAHSLRVPKFDLRQPYPVINLPVWPARLWVRRS